jgi:hypothetical protein
MTWVWVGVCVFVFVTPHIPVHYLPFVRMTASSCHPPRLGPGWFLAVERPNKVRGPLS